MVPKSHKVVLMMAPRYLRCAGQGGVADMTIPGSLGTDVEGTSPRVPLLWLLPSRLAVPDALRRRKPTLVHCPVSIQSL